MFAFLVLGASARLIVCFAVCENRPSTYINPDKDKSRTSGPHAGLPKIWPSKNVPLSSLCVPGHTTLVEHSAGRA